ncbi:MAG: hypothetical protein AAGF54_18525 [Pseudomonadota bacterium]
MKTHKLPIDLDQLIAKEKRSLVGEYFEEVWQEITQDGVEEHVIVEKFIECGLSKINESHGTDEVARIIRHFKDLSDMGALPSGRTLQ